MSRAVSNCCLSLGFKGLPLPGQVSGLPEDPGGALAFGGALGADFRFFALFDEVVLHSFSEMADVSLVDL